VPFTSFNPQFQGCEAKVREEKNITVKLADLLMLPITRIPQYHKNLQDLAENTPHSCSDMATIHRAFYKAKKLTEKVEDFRKDYKQFQRLLSIEALFADKNLVYLISLFLLSYEYFRESLNLTEFFYQKER